MVKSWLWQLWSSAFIFGVFRKQLPVASSLAKCIETFGLKGISKPNFPIHFLVSDVTAPFNSIPSDEMSSVCSLNLIAVQLSSEGLHNLCSTDLLLRQQREAEERKLREKVLEARHFARTKAQRRELTSEGIEVSNSD